MLSGPCLPQKAHSFTKSVQLHLLRCNSTTARQLVVQGSKGTLAASNTEHQEGRCHSKASVNVQK